MQFNELDGYQTSQINESLNYQDLENVQDENDGTQLQINDLWDYLEVEPEERELVGQILVNQPHKQGEYINTLINATQCKNCFIKYYLLMEEAINSLILILDEKQHKDTSQLQKKLVFLMFRIKTTIIMIIRVIEQARKLTCNQFTTLPDFTLQVQSFAFKLFHKPFFTRLRLINLVVYLKYCDQQEASMRVMKLYDEIKLKQLSDKHLNLMIAINPSILNYQLIDKIHYFMETLLYKFYQIKVEKYDVKSIYRIIVDETGMVAREATKYIEIMKQTNSDTINVEQTIKFPLDCSMNKILIQQLKYKQVEKVVSTSDILEKFAQPSYKLQYEESIRRKTINWLKYSQLPKENQKEQQSGDTNTIDNKD